MDGGVDTKTMGQPRNNATNMSTSHLTDFVNLKEQCFSFKSSNGHR